MGRRLSTQLALLAGGLVLLLALGLLAVLPLLLAREHEALAARQLQARAAAAAALASSALAAAGCDALATCPPDRLDPAALAAQLAAATGAHVTLAGPNGRVWYAAPPGAAPPAALPAARAAVGDPAAPRIAIELVPPVASGPASPLVLGLLGVGLASALLAGVAAWRLGRGLECRLDALRQRVLVAAEHLPAAPPLVLPPGAPPALDRLAAAIERLLATARAQLRLREAERDRLDTILAHLADSVVIIAGGRIARLNPAAERLLGVRQAAAAGRTVAEVLRDHELVALVERGATEGTGAAFIEWRAPRRFLRASVTRLPGTADGQLLLVLHDLTELRRLEAVRRDFVANVSHDLRTPIAAVRAMVETLQDGAIDDPAAARDFLGRIEQEVLGLHRLVEQLLELSRLEAGHVRLALAPTDPAPLVASAVRRLTPLAERAGVALRAALPPALPPILVDAERITHVLIGVLHNAIKFTPPGGEIVVSAAVEPDRVRLSVRDTGVGLAPEQLERIFERFYKADEARAGGGTGLGLAIAKHTVQLHGGRIWAESAGPQRGTTVQIALPRAVPGASAASAPRSAGAEAEGHSPAAS
jgi:two-component system phosphate regulon sensor histidine kinase PhoR